MPDDWEKQKQQAQSPFHDEPRPKRDLTNRILGEPYLENNGLGRYSIVRDTLEGKQYANVSRDLETAIIRDMQAKRARGRFGHDDSPDWYPIDYKLAQSIGWESDTWEDAKRAAQSPFHNELVTTIEQQAVSAFMDKWTQDYMMHGPPTPEEGQALKLAIDRLNQLADQHLKGDSRSEFLRLKDEFKSTYDLIANLEAVYEIAEEKVSQLSNLPTTVAEIDAHAKQVIRKWQDRNPSAPEPERDIDLEPNL